MLQERRRFLRKRCYLPVRLYPQGAATVIETLSKDISTGGLKCLSPIPVPIATPLSIELDLGIGKGVVFLRGHAAWFQEIPQSDQCYLGVIFDDPSEHSRQLLSRYIEPLAKNPSLV